jgi:RecA-family ATPase
MKPRNQTNKINDDPSVELLIKLTDREINLFRLAMSRAAAEDKAKEATKMLFKTLKQRQCRYTVRELGGLPGVARGADKQQLLSWNVGASSYAEWQFINSADGSEVFDLDSLREFDRENDPDCMIGNRWLCRGHSVVVQGPTGIGKSSFVLQMLMTWAKGDSFFGFQPKGKLKSVLIQAENDMGDIAEAFHFRTSCGTCTLVNRLTRSGWRLRRT